MSKEPKYDLEDRLIDYAVHIIKLSEALPPSKAAKHVSNQILRSGTCAPLIMEKHRVLSQKLTLFTS